MIKPDIIVCPGQNWGIEEVLLKQHRWYAVEINKERISSLKYLAIYEKKPIKGIRYIGKIKKIQPYNDSGKYEILLDGSVKKIKIIKRSKNKPNLAPQNRQYTLKKLLDKAEWLEDIFGEKLKEELNSNLTSK